MGIQHYFIRKKIKLALTSHEMQLQKTELSKIRNVALLVDESSSFNYTFFKQLQKLMNLDDTHYNILTIKHKKSNYNEFKGVVLLTNEVNWKGDIQSAELHHFLDPHYDLLIDFIPQNSPLKQLIVAQVQAKMKVGYADNNPEFYNILMKVEPTLMDVFISELVKYLSILKII